VTNGDSVVAWAAAQVGVIDATHIGDKPMSDLEEPNVSWRVGLLGELEVEIQLVRQRWHPVRLDTAQMASNADLVAVNREKRVAIQVKTTNGKIQDLHSKWLTFGYSTSYLRDGYDIFNSKESPLIADVVVAVHYRPNDSQFVVLPVAFAEKLCRKYADYWSGIPAKKRGTGQMGERSKTFPMWLRLCQEIT
jgi:hypothetical protein